MNSRLTPLQRELLQAFFRQESRFFLTGGAALAGFHLGHRVTLDLDLFTTEAVLDEGEVSLRRAADELGATVEALRTAPEFRRRLVLRGEESVVVDLVRDRAPQIHEQKLDCAGLRVDSADEIAANKLCALLSMAETRDLVDVMMLEQAGVDLDAAMRAAARKDAGLTPGELSFVLSQISIGAEAQLPGDVSGEAMQRWLQRFLDRLARMAFPDAG